MHKFKKSKALEETLNEFTKDGIIESGTGGWCCLLAVAFPTSKFDVTSGCFEEDGQEIDMDSLFQWLEEKGVEAV